VPMGSGRGMEELTRTVKVANCPQCQYKPFPRIKNSRLSSVVRTSEVNQLASVVTHHLSVMTCRRQPFTDEIRNHYVGA
jgi:hypothetical protein